MTKIVTLLIAVTFFNTACGSKKSNQSSKKNPAQLQQSEDSTLPVPSPPAAPSPSPNDNPNDSSGGALPGPETPLEPGTPNGPSTPPQPDSGSTPPTPIPTPVPNPGPGPGPGPENDPETAPSSGLSSDLANGDLIFQVSQTPQSSAIAEATGSKWTNVGILFKKRGEWFVLEVAQKVAPIGLRQFISKGAGQEFVIKRLDPQVVTMDQQAGEALNRTAQQFLAKPSDRYFQWSDRAMYSSELVFKIFEQALNIEIGKIERLRDLNLEGPIMTRLIATHGREIGRVDMNQEVVTPGSQFDSEVLLSVPNPRIP